MTTARVKENLHAYLMLSPALLGLLAFTLFPMLAALLLGFLNWNIASEPAWAGLANYRELLNDPTVLIGLRNTLWWVVMTVPLGIGVSLCLALALNRPIRGVGLFRTVFYLPVITPLLVVALLFEWLYNADFGLFNWFFGLFGLGPFNFLGDPGSALPAIAAMSVWKNAGSNMIIYLAALKGIPQHLYEAADVEGASRWNKFRHITLPMLGPANFFIGIMTMIAAFQVFTEIYIMTEGGPSFSTTTLAYAMWSNAFGYSRLGYAGAIANVMFILILIITLIWIRLYGRRVYYEE